jgi:hypothetical protein
MHFGVVERVKLAAIVIVKDDGVVERGFGIHSDQTRRKGAGSGSDE